MTAAEMLAVLRTRTGQSVDTMANNIGCTPEHLRRIHLGTAGITAGDLREIFKHYDIGLMEAEALLLTSAEYIINGYASKLNKLPDKDAETLKEGKWNCEYEPKKIISQGPATVVIWKDGTKTVVKKADGDDHDVYAAFCAALAKKTYGGNSTVKNIVDRNIVIKR